MLIAVFQVLLLHLSSNSNPFVCIGIFFNIHIVQNWVYYLRNVSTLFMDWRINIGPLETEHSSVVSIFVWGLTGAGRRRGRWLMFSFLLSLLVMFPMLPFVFFALLLVTFQFLFILPALLIRRAGLAAFLFLLCGLFVTRGRNRSSK